MIATMTAVTHTPVMVDEAIQALAVHADGRYVDCTLGGGGHAAAILERSTPDGRLLGIDADPQAIDLARERLALYGDRAIIVRDNFENLKEICESRGFAPVQGILFDLGLSSMLLESSRRGFSFARDEPLDMRFSPDQEVTAADIVNTYSEADLADLIFTLGEERLGRRLARYIVHERPINTTLELVGVIMEATGGHRGRIHPATRTFQALRIAVNSELEHLRSTLKQTVDLLDAGGRLVVISYHSLEDRIVKLFMREEAKESSFRLINKKIITPSSAEMHFNPRSRSARIRAAERIV